MDFDDNAADAEYRSQLRKFLQTHHAELEHGDGEYLVEPGVDNVEALRRTQALLFDAGYVGVTWPWRYGGQSGTPSQQAIVTEELARASIPALINYLGIGMCGPTILAHGSEDQKNRYLRRLLRADDIWCQLFSEPGSGSDLAALRTTATCWDDGTWRVNGQKVWTTGAHNSDFGILLARTDRTAAKHSGLTMFVVDMHAPGVTVRPLRQMNGSAEFNEVFFDDVAIDDSERLGDVNDGWRVALTTLMHERIAVGGGGNDVGVRPEALLRHAAERIPALPAPRQALARQALGRVLVETLAARYTGYRRLTALTRGEIPGPEASAGKLSAVRIARAGADLGVRLLGDEAVYAKTASGQWLWPTAQASVPGTAIAGGTDEILRNILGERVLGLPPEPRPVDPAGAGTGNGSVLDSSPRGSAPSIDAAHATEFLALDGDTLIAGTGEITVGEPIDPTRGLASVRLTSQQVLRENAGALWERARLVAAVIMAAEDLGAADAAVAIAADYARSRQTFGRAIGSYQAVKHRLVDVWAGVEQLRSLVWWAAWTADAAPDDLPLAASAVKAYSARVLEEAAEALIHVHGGIGFTWEHDAHVYWRRAKVDRLLLGDEAEYLDRVADLALTGARL
jgi:alkylation response protein AidB-like acyl-CoA dehydrogenase